MGLKIGLQLQGKFWRDLSESEVEEIEQQIKSIKDDPCYRDYRYFKTKFHKWIIVNAFLVPMKVTTPVWSNS